MVIQYSNNSTELPSNASPLSFNTLPEENTENSHDPVPLQPILVTRNYQRLKDQTFKNIFISYVAQGKTPKEIARTLMMPRKTVYRYIARVHDHGNLESQNFGGYRYRKLTPEHDFRIKEWLDDDAGLTLQDIQQKLFETFDIKVSISCINNHIDSFHYTFKKATHIPEQWNTAVNIEKRTAYANMFTEIRRNHDDNKFVFINEVGFSISLRRGMGRSLKGTKAFIDTPAIRSVNRTVIATMTHTGMLHHKILLGPCTGLLYAEFLEELMLN